MTEILSEISQVETKESAARCNADAGNRMRMFPSESAGKSGLVTIFTTRGLMVGLRVVRLRSTARRHLRSWLQRQCDCEPPRGDAGIKKQ